MGDAEGKKSLAQQGRRKAVSKKANSKTLGLIKTEKGSRDVRLRCRSEESDEGGLGEGNN